MATSIKYPTSTNAVQKTLDAALLAGATTSMTLNSVTGIQNKAGVCVVDRVDANGSDTASKREYITFTGVSGSTLTGLTRNADGGGTDQDHAVGAIVEFVSDVLQQQAIIDGLLNVVTTAGALDTTKVTDLTTAQTLTNKTLTSPKINENVALTATSTQIDAIKGASIDGWTTITGTFTYNAANKINVASGAASIYNKGDKLRFQNNDSGTWLYVYVIAIADTVLTVVGNTVPNATLTDAYYSHQSSPLGFPTYFTHTPTITWTAGTAPSGTPMRKDVYWIDGGICHVRGNTYNWTAGTAVTNAYIALPFTITTQFQQAVGMISLTDTNSPDCQYAYVRNGDIQINCSSVNATYLSYSADYYY